jgi:Tfp pilus assembly protein PilO
MPRSSRFNLNFDWRALAARAWRERNRADMARAGLGLLLALNLVMTWFMFHPPGGSTEDLEGAIAATRQQIAQRQQAIARLSRIIDKTVQARRAGEVFLAQYFLPRKHAYSQLETALGATARTAGIKAKDRTFNYEPVEGSDTLGMLSINANYEGTYADLISFVNQIDRMNRLVIIDSLTAQPVQGSQVLAINLRLAAFFRFEGPQEPGEAKVADVAEVRP